EGFLFIGLHEGPVMKMGDGHWAPQDVHWLDETLKRLRSKDQPVIFLTHYPVDNGIDNWYAVLDLLKQYNTQAILSGHGHGNHHYLFEGVPGVMGRSNLRAGKPGPGYNVVEVKAGQMTFFERRSGKQTLASWHAVALEQHNYSAETNHYPRPDFSVNSRWPAVKERWAGHTGYTIASSPTVWQDRAIVGDASGTVYAFEIGTGRVRWRFRAKNAVYSTPA